MKYEAKTVDEYLSALPPERLEAVTKLRNLISKNLPPGFEETLSYGMPAWVVPFSAYPAGYHCKPAEPVPFISLASQKNFISFYHMGLYAKPEIIEWFKAEYGRLGIGKLDIGKCCIRLKKAENIPWELLAELCRKITLPEWIASYEASLK